MSYAIITEVHTLDDALFEKGSSMTKLGKCTISIDRAFLAPSQPGWIVGHVSVSIRKKDISTGKDIVWICASPRICCPAKRSIGWSADREGAAILACIFNGHGEGDEFLKFFPFECSSIGNEACRMLRDAHQRAT